MAKSKTDAEKDRKVTALIEVANYLWKEFDGRRAQEWKANFALWAALAALVGFSTWQDVKISRGLAWGISIFLAWIFLVYWIAWTTGMWRRNFETTQDANEALSRARAIVNEPALRKSRRRRQPEPRWDAWDYLNVARNWSRGSQLAFTLAFTIIAAVSIWFRVSPSAPNVTQNNLPSILMPPPTGTLPTINSPQPPSVPIRP